MSLNPIEDVSRTLAALAEQAVGRVNGGLPGPSGAAPQTDVPVPEAPQASAPAKTVRAQVLSQAGLEAVVRQDGLGHLMAELAGALEGGALPETLGPDVSRVMDRLAPLDQSVTGPDVENALRRSGLMLESGLAQHPNEPPQDLKSALLLLRQGLALPPGPRRTTGAVRPPPPYAGGPIAGQPAYSEPVDLEASADLRRQRLADAVDGALARVELEQIASLPQKESDPTIWRFEAPVSTPQGASIAQFEIQRESHGRTSGAPSTATWRVRFGLDIAPFGPVSANLSLTGEHLGVALWVQNPDAAATLRSQAPDLARGLLGPGLEVDVAVYHGAPSSAPAVAGRLLDTAI